MSIPSPFMPRESDANSVDQRSVLLLDAPELLLILHKTRYWMAALNLAGIILLLLSGVIVLAGAAQVGGIALARGAAVITPFALPLLFMLDYTGKIKMFLNYRTSTALLRMFAAQRRMWTAFGVLAIAGWIGLAIALLAVLSAPQVEWTF